MGLFCFSNKEINLNNKHLRNPRTHNESRQIDSESIHYVRSKRNLENLPCSRSDLHRCEDKNTNRKIRMSHNDFRNSIKHLPILEPFSVMDTIPNIEDI